ncbi:hypothetical protein CCO03_16925 [Comamonas serinivorans]|uniref:DUF2514 domain-containing protein n=1 Tax=Comamonas serinivorans TaxID=1082851 RepID=A0A1Y0ERT0_9BURK|nr:DUF2514 family protein [Comamonas serinivorans]ARU06130.1 hypothetical protein CCO03_16925 [Comamonas serinivorans]
MTSRIESVLAAIVAAAILGLAAWWHTGQVKKAEQAVHAHYAAVLADIRDKTATAATAFRARETQWQTHIEKETQDGQDRIDAARRDAIGARAAADGLRADLARYRAAARATQDPCAAAAGPPASDALDLLADLLTGADEAAGELAAAADLAHAAGFTCERAYDALTNQL